MLVHHSKAPSHFSAHGPEPTPWEGSPTGMGADTLALSPLTVQQNVPNIGEAQYAPQTQVIAPLEQGDGRSPGWKWGWMRKNIPLTLAELAHRQRKFGSLRTEYAVGYAHPPGSGPGQAVALHNTKRKPTSLAEPETVYFTAAAPPTPTWGEPL
jgi:hypothetical protein